MSHYKKVDYAGIIKSLIMMSRIKGKAIPLTQAVKVVEKQTGLIVDRAHIISMLKTQGRYHQEIIQDGDIRRVQDQIVPKFIYNEDDQKWITSG